MTSGEVLVQLDDDVLQATINRPEKNPLSRLVLAAIGEAFRVHRDRAQERRLGLVTAAGTKSFAAGGDRGKSNSICEDRGVQTVLQWRSMPRSMRSAASRYP